MNQQPPVIYLKDYQVPSHIIDTTYLDIHIDIHKTRVISTLQVRRNPASQAASSHLQLHGGKLLELVSVSIDGKQLAANSYSREGTDLVLPDCPAVFELRTECLIEPQNNSSLEGLYQSGSMFCTQCEAEGFRNITFYLDRPDAMSVFTTRISAPKSQYPVLLANGNPLEQGDEEQGRHFAVWHDPFPKPAYLFAMVAGDLVLQADSFTTSSGREVALHIFVEAHNSHKCEHAMAALQRSMRWDEQVYGREYDLDLFMIVAVDDFNMGAMENKGLNIFNSDCVLADPDTATDAMFERIEGIVAHEYFHNWSGNRVTCRDWFQLSLKEGFTVFRDAQYTADIYSRTVKRIDDVTVLRTAQFAEDGGPMAHPIRPASYIEISNFYSVTVYEKGAEVVGMIHTLLGPEMFRKGSDLYFERHDGQAVTTDDFVSAMEDASDIDLSQFKRWYCQAGTPTVKVWDEYNQQTQEYRLHMQQSTPPTPEAEHKLPFLIPLRMALLDAQGQALKPHWPAQACVLSSDANEAVIAMTAEQQTFCFTGVSSRPVPSLLRGFSAPIKLDYPYSKQQLLFLAQHDDDGFNRWEAVQRLLLQALQEVMDEVSLGDAVDDRLLALLASFLADTDLDAALVARLMLLPSEAYLAEMQDQVDVDLIYACRETVRAYIAQNLQAELEACYSRCQDHGPFAQDGQAIGRRALKNTCLLYLSALGDEAHLALAQTQYDAQANMTDVNAALQAIIALDDQAAETALAQFYSRWQQDAQVVDQWFALQAGVNQPDRIDKVKALMQHPAFDIKNPNKVRSVLGGFMRSAINFHAADGSGYAFIAQQIIALNAINPMMAASLSKPLGRFKKHTPERQALVREQLQHILANQPSKDVYEVVSKALAQ
ncbi:MAG: aminopeptidase N [Gammaproteobacteria bacterium]|jgi:aminopeptidase N|nr:aminopeptidase N [Gammaproteobacteria bacterium]